jgi:hypothetical protein
MKALSGTEELIDIHHANSHAILAYYCGSTEKSCRNINWDQK